VATAPGSDVTEGDCVDVEDVETAVAVLLPLAARASTDILLFDELAVLELAEVSEVDVVPADVVGSWVWAWAVEVCAAVVLVVGAAVVDVDVAATIMVAIDVGSVATKLYVGSTVPDSQAMGSAVKSNVGSSQHE